MIVKHVNQYSINITLLTEFENIKLEKHEEKYGEGRTKEELSRLEC